MKKTIVALLVDDSRSVRALVKGVLGSMNSDELEIDVKEAEDGQQAVDLACSLNPDLIFMDVNMPNMDGLEAVEKIREVNKDVVITMVTSDSGKTTVQRAIGSHINGYIVKPIDPDKIIDFVNKFVNRVEQ